MKQQSLKTLVETYFVFKNNVSAPVFKISLYQNAATVMEGQKDEKIDVVQDYYQKGRCTPAIINSGHPQLESTKEGMKQILLCSKTKAFIISQHSWLPQA